MADSILKFVLHIYNNQQTVEQELKIQVECQTLIIDRLRRDIESLQQKNHNISTEVNVNTKEITKLTSERDVCKRELQIEKKLTESLKRERDEFQKRLENIERMRDLENEKKKKLRTHFNTLNRSIGSDENKEVKDALHELRETLTN